jgi:hypothetical protein
LPLRDETRAFQHLDMPGHGGKAHLEGRRQFVDRGIALGKPGQDGPPDRMRECRESCVELFRCHIISINTSVN